MIEEYDISCPFCGETIAVLIDCSAGNQRYTEDCQVCCSPIDIAVELDHDGTILTVSAEQENG